MHCTFNFRPVGQGGFFTGDFLKQGNLTFQMVYDCGSLTAGAFLAGQISDARNNFRIVDGLSTVDMVIISHFDEDHVNGVIELLQNVRCRLLVIPFMTIFERLTVYARRGAKADWHRRLLENPQAFFLGNEFNIDQVIMIDGNNEPLNETTDNTLQLEAEPIDSGGAAGPLQMRDDTFAFTNRFVYMRIPLTIEERRLGLSFKFYIKSFPDAYITAFQTALATAFPHQPAANLFEDKNRLVIKGLYKTIFGNINKTSLCVGIRRPHRAKLWYNDDPNLLFDYEPRKSGFLLTGDSFLKSRRDRLAFLNYYRDDLPDILVFQIPHHGSKANSTLNPTNELWNFRVFAMQYGHGRKKHPSPELNSFVIMQHFQVHRITEQTGLIISYEIS